MSSLASIADGAITAKPFVSAPHGRIAAPLQAPTATGTSETPEDDAIGELGTLIASLGSLSAQAQSLPLSPPELPGLPQDQNYRPQTTDYSQFVDDAG